MKEIRLVIAWLWVAIPLGWGVMKSVQKAKPLFTSESAAATTPAK